MKPLRRLMNEIETVTDFDSMNWSIIADPKAIAGPGPVTNDDFLNAISTTKAAA
jgi:hypothetical protein